jgi:hypothetical protein
LLPEEAFMPLILPNEPYHVLGDKEASFLKPFLSRRAFADLSWVASFPFKKRDGTIGGTLCVIGPHGSPLPSLARIDDALPVLDAANIILDQSREFGEAFRNAASGLLSSVEKRIEHAPSLRIITLSYERSIESIMSKAESSDLPLLLSCIDSTIGKVLSGYGHVRQIGPGRIAVIAPCTDSFDGELFAQGLGAAISTKIQLFPEDGISLVACSEAKSLLEAEDALRVS